MKLIERTLYLRQLYEIKNTPDIKIITGIRRAGKSKLLESFIQYISSSEKDSNIIHVDLTKLKFERLKQYHVLNDYIESSYAPGVSNYVMIDEIQLCENFELVVNSLYSEQKYDIYITGSNAFLLSSDLSTLFTGRYIEIQVFPFSFKEFCNYFNEEKDIQKQLDRYIIIGGLAGSYQREIVPLLQIRDAYPKFLLARTRYGESDYEGIKIIDVAEWLMQ